MLGGFSAEFERTALVMLEQIPGCVGNPETMHRIALPTAVVENMSPTYLTSDAFAWSSARALAPAFK
jgi:hypothetical protein